MSKIKTVVVRGDQGGTGRPFPITGRSIKARVRFSIDAIPSGTTIKLIGLTDPLRGIGPILRGDSPSHGCSDRIVARWNAKGVELRTYAYRGGKKVHSETLCMVPVSADPVWTEWVTVNIELMIGTGAVYVVMRHPDQLDYTDYLGSKFVESPWRSPIQWLEWSHGRNGAESPALPVPVTYQIEVL